MDSQAETRLWQRLIDVENAIKKLEENNTHSGEAYSGLLSRLDNYENRIVELEKARARQIQLNEQFHTHTAGIETQPASLIEGLFRWFIKRKK